MPTSTQDEAIKDGLKQMLQGFAQLQTALQLETADPATLQIINALQQISTHIDRSDFPNANDMAVLAAAKAAVKEQKR